MRARQRGGIVKRFPAMAISLLWNPLPVFAQDVFNLTPVEDFTKFRNEFGWRDDYRERCELNRPLQQMVDAVAAEDSGRILAVTIP